MQRSSLFQMKVGWETTCSVIFAPQMYVFPLEKGKAFQLVVSVLSGHILLHSNMLHWT